MEYLKADVVIIGAGTAGMSAFRSAREHTDNVYLIEANHYGTTCARVGCMPSKLLIAAANASYDVLHTSPFGISIDGQIVINDKDVMDRVKFERDRFVSFVIDDIKEFPQDKLIFAKASFIDKNNILIDNHTTINTKTVVIATGSSSFIDRSWIVLKDKLVTNDDIFSWDNLPNSIAICGAGVIGIELGQALHRLGVKTHIFNRGDSFGGISDPVILKIAKDIFKEELNITFNAKLKVSLNSDNKVEVSYTKDGKSVTDIFDYFLAASGRTPNLSNIGLENLNLKLNAKNVPIFDSLTMQTSEDNIFIAGDASNEIPLLHEASDQGKIAGSNAALFPNIKNGLRRSLLSIIFSSPEIASVGSKWNTINNKYNVDEIAIGEVSFYNQGRSRVMLVNKGYMRIYAHKETGIFLGSEMVAPAGEHLAHLLSWAHQLKLTIKQMLDLPFYHPVIEEGLRTALRDCLKQIK